jgi:hypothetical protein
MIETEHVLIIVFALLLGGVWIHLASRRLSWPFRAPLLVFLVSYLVTYVVGAVVIALTNADIVELYWGDANEMPGQVLGSTTYWALLLLPFVVVPWVVHAGMRLSVRKQQASGPPIERRVGLLLPLAFYATGVAALLLNATYRAAVQSPFAFLQAGSRDVLYAMRVDLLDMLRTWEAAFLYTGAPFLSFVVVLEALRTGRRLHQLAGFALVLVTAVLQVALSQLGPTMIFGVALGTTVYASTRHQSRWWTWAASAGFLAVVAQYFTIKHGDRDPIVSALELFLRMPVAYPYYLAYTNIHGHGGIKLLALLTAGRAEAQTPYATIIGHFMFPWLKSGDGFTPAPAHVSAYFDAGFPYAIVILGVAGLLICLAGTIFARSKDSPVDRAFAISVCVAIYTMTQSQLGSALMESWGFMWAAALWWALRTFSRTQPVAATPLSDAASTASFAPPSPNGLRPLRPSSSSLARVVRAAKPSSSPRRYST